MKAFSFDIEYLIEKMSDMSGLPIRIYKKGKLINVYANVSLIYDPVILYFDELNNLSGNVNYYISENFDYYGIINSKDLKIIIGPSRLSPLNNQELSDLAFSLNVPNKDMNAFITSMNAIIPMPLDSIIQMMCTINHILNNEKLNLSDFQIKEGKNENINYENLSSPSDIYKNYNIEKQIIEMVKSGNVELLNNWVKNAPSIRSGVLSSNLLRHNKNTFIVTTTLISRAAIDVGMAIEDAFKLSDSFIQKCENAKDANEFNALQYDMVLTFTKEINILKNKTNNHLSNEVYHYIVHHISEAIKTEDIANSLYISRSHLSTIFKKSQGISLNEYIRQIKIDKAKELLKDDSKSIILISDYLGFSSSSHFNRIFKKITGNTPKEYRKSI